MFGIGFFEMIVIAIVGLLVIGLPIAVIVTVVALNSRGRDDRRE
jgi:hypothetical protein